MLKLSLKPTLIGLVLFVISMVYYTHAALTFPVLFNLDNHLNYAATEYIAEHRKIPAVKADDPEILFTEIGTTRSLRPPFTFIVSAIASNLTANIIDHRITRQRLGSPLIGALTVVVFVGFWLAFNHIGLALWGRQRSVCYPNLSSSPPAAMMTLARYYRSACCLPAS